MLSFSTSRPRDGRARSRDDAGTREGPANQEPAGATPSRFGWDASSLDLLEGCEVTEHSALDTMPAEFDGLVR